MIVYVSIGNSDDKLSQERWATFILRVRTALDAFARTIHGQWYSAPDAAFQNACFCIEIEDQLSVDELKTSLAIQAAAFDQDSIAWAEVPYTEFIEGRKP